MGADGVCGPASGPLALRYSLTAAASECIFGQLTPASRPGSRAPLAVPPPTLQTLARCRRPAAATPARPSRLPHWLDPNRGTAPLRFLFDRGSAGCARLELARRPRPLVCNAIGPSASPPTAPGGGHALEPQVGPRSCQSSRDPKARGGARLGNWSTLTLKPRPVAGGSLERETNREPGKESETKHAE